MQKLDINIQMDRRKLKPGYDRRQFSYAAYLPDRRQGRDRRAKDMAVRSGRKGNLSWL